MNTSVVIPYFQRETGVLRRALNSIEGQFDLGILKEVIIVDDGSPAPVDKELNGLSRIKDRITILRQKNLGVSSARNRALDYLSQGYDGFVSFLDSDDIWSPYYLTRLRAALDNGSDFFFTNFTQLDQSIGAFERAERIQLSDHEKIQGSLYKYVGSMPTQIISGNIIGTSTVTYNFGKYRNLRFKIELKFAGEDYLFWLEIAFQNPKIMFDSDVLVTYESGVNIYSSAQWGTIHLLRRQLDEIKFRRYLLTNYKLPAGSVSALQKHTEKLKKEYSSNLKSCLKRGNLKAVPFLLQLNKLNPEV